MRLVVDSSVIVAELLRVSGRARLADPRLDLFIADHVWSEIHHEIPKRVAAFSRRHNLPDESANELVSLIFATIEAATVIGPEVVYAPVEDDARWRCARDADDWPTVALALTIDASIWTEDGDFLGTGVATWSTTTVTAWLERQAEP